MAIDELRAAGFEVLPARRSSHTVLDTFDGRLHAAGLRLEHHGGPSATLLLRSADDAPPAVVDRMKPPTWPADVPPGPFRDRIAAVTKERALLPVVTISSQVHEGRLLDRRGKTVVRVIVHEGVEPAGRSTSAAPSWAAEVGPVAGHQDAADTAVARLSAAGLEQLDGDLAENVARAVGSPLSGYDSSPTVALDPTEDAFGAFRRVLLNLATTVEANLPGTVDDIDPEFLHDLRVAVRRTRSVLAQSKGVLPKDIRRQYRDEFGWLGQLTGPPRDLDVYLLGWDQYVAPLDPADRMTLETVRRALQDHRNTAHRQLSTHLQSARTTELLTSWQEWLLDPTIEPKDPQPIGPVVVDRISAAQRKVLRDGRMITEATPAERLHDLRKDTKTLRYLLECFGGLLPSGPRKRFVSQLKDLQDNLGEHQDAEVHLTELRELARDLHARGDVDADVLLAMGRLSNHLERRRREEREAFAERFAGYDTKANRRVLHALLGEVDGA
ncbi:MAG: CHAD domain-containing protein [Acidimicrobiales bacterium]